MNAGRSASHRLSANPQNKRLSAVKTYIAKYHHLPGIPTEQQITKNGLNLGEMNKLLTKKIEELTLYLIEEDRNDKKQEDVNRNQQLKLNELEVVNKLNQLRIEKLEREIALLVKK
ncbi:MAG: hypothetical protein ACHQHN_11875 [Sphingobacteriales bacterium]